MRSRRIVYLPKWKQTAIASQGYAEYSYDKSTTEPVHPCLLEIHGSAEYSNVALRDAIQVFRKQYRNLVLNDLKFVLELIQDGSSNQEEFWEYVAVLVRRSLPQIKTISKTATNEWQRTLAYALLEVYWKQNQSVFLEQVEKAFERTADQETSQSKSRPSDAEIIAHIVIESLLATFYPKSALELYDMLSLRGIDMPRRILASLIRIATAQGDDYQLERIGNMMIRHEELYQGALESATTRSRPFNRPLLMSPKLMDVFIRGACENQLYDLARKVFDRGLAAGENYRVITFTRILNSFSVKEFGFDILLASETHEKRTEHICRPKRTEILGSEESSKYSQLERDSSVFAPSSIGRKITVAEPQDIQKYTLAMQAQGVKPNMTTLNVLVKLYLEMAQYKVSNAPAWKTVFIDFNPLKLEPDIVTYNTLLAYYAAHKDLLTMRKIYDHMAGTLDGEWLKSRKAERRRRINDASTNQDIDPSALNSNIIHQPHSNDSDVAEEIEKLPSEKRRPSPSPQMRSHRDIYTYNIMLHALLQHAVETKDIASIGQCFHDMEQDGIPADTITFNTNILYHITRGDVSAALQVFRSMKPVNRKVSMPAFTDDPWDGERDLRTFGFNNVSLRRSSKPVRSTPSYIGKPPTDGAMSGRLKTDDSVQSQPNNETHLLSTSMLEVDSPPAPDVVTFTSLISGFAHLNQMDKATNVFKEMTNQFHIEPNLKTYTTLIAGLHQTGDHKRAEQLWEIVVNGNKAPCSRVGGYNNHIKDHERQSNNECPPTAGEVALQEDEKDERLEYQQMLQGQPTEHLTVMERRQIETRCKLYKEQLKC
ncbi:hypothetical protein BX616_009669 [Lobosporangium transversale]|uniref:Pentacotripeptide-repeat region of PRORP domain-containing protein n=1 Tax=Lobosporangium transversale TaxID=64571 RepID=A0A1Y2G9G5_9FUNG|nr:hypothetical protein BCR41DRAFT_375475 [Lobosporangium transversale]KAF9918277.1 hypothetical protein BX616_009669 [Lobosporangium transversale]ORY99510.1 hypothetical protein BCR41DRAFT_375475 [Lobosporangium transversale]|eukprot:XP_021875836.1 hypothetical protein BCR41DRAFT_375475 [Lobosporangium transversale]